jgi:hypothetical protein
MQSCSVLCAGQQVKLHLSHHRHVGGLGQASLRGDASKLLLAIFSGATLPGAANANARCWRMSTPRTAACKMDRLSLSGEMIRMSSELYWVSVMERSCRAGSARQQHEVSLRMGSDAEVHGCQPAPTWRMRTSTSLALSEGVPS